MAAVVLEGQAQHGMAMGQSIRQPTAWSRVQPHFKHQLCILLTARPGGFCACLEVAAASVSIPPFCPSAFPTALPTALEPSRSCASAASCRSTSCAWRWCWEACLAAAAPPLLTVSV